MPPALATFDLFPRLCTTEIKQVWVTAAHLRLELVSYVGGGEISQFFRNDELKGQMQQEVAQLSADLSDLSFAQRVVQLQDLFHQVRAQGLAGLGSVPGTPIPEVAHGCHSASKR
jgi:hypothetical protein